MSTITLRINEDEKKLLEKMAEFSGVGLSTYIKNTVFEKLEDEYDIKLAEQSYEEYVRNGKKSKPITDLWDELGL
jgi:uncharacterized protein (DUF1778 family)